VGLIAAGLLISFAEQKYDTSKAKAKK